MLGFLLGYGLLHDGIHALKDLSHGHDEDGTYRDSYGARCWCTTGDVCTYTYNDKGDFGIGDYIGNRLYRNFHMEIRDVRWHNAVHDLERTAFLFSENSKWSHYINEEFTDSKYIYCNIFSKKPDYNDRYMIIANKTYFFTAKTGEKRKTKRNLYFYANARTGKLIRPSDGELREAKKEGIDYSEFYKIIIKECNEEREFYINEQKKKGKEIKYYISPQLVVGGKDIYDFDEKYSDVDKKRLKYDDVKNLLPKYQEQDIAKLKERIKNNQIPKEWT